MTDDFNDILFQTGVEAAEHGAKHALHHYRRRRNTLKTFDHDIKLELDVECQDQIQEFIGKRFPQHAFLGEEDASLQQSESAKYNLDHADYEWIIDPIDGTVNFSSGLPMWCCSVAVRRRYDQEIIAGCVCAPMLNACYAAQIGKPATRNGSPIRTSTTESLQNAMVMTGMDHDLKPGVPPLACFSKIAASARKARIAGSAAVDLCWVAEGAADGYFEGSIFLWDFAASALIARQAGAITETLWSGSLPNQMAILASNGLIHDALKAQILEATEVPPSPHRG